MFRWYMVAIYIPMLFTHTTSGLWGAFANLKSCIYLYLLTLVHHVIFCADTLLTILYLPLFEIIFHYLESLPCLRNVL